MLPMPPGPHPATSPHQRSRWPNDQPTRPVRPVQHSQTEWLRRVGPIGRRAVDDPPPGAFARDCGTDHQWTGRGSRTGLVDGGYECAFTLAEDQRADEFCSAGASWSDAQAHPQPTDPLSALACRCSSLGRLQSYGLTIPVTMEVHTRRASCLSTRSIHPCTNPARSGFRPSGWPR